MTVAQALQHPNWNMGPKVTIDSATMANKGLEVIEARWLFDLPESRIDVVVHPQSIIHSMVVCRDHSILAQLGTPDMRVPIAYGLSWPNSIESGADVLDFSRLSALTFEEADATRFPGLQLAWATLKAPAGSTAILNAANEVAVESFLNRRIRFDQIHELNVRTLDAVHAAAGECASVHGLLQLDARARREAARLVSTMVA